MSEVCVVERHVPAPPDVVYDAWLDPASLRVWICPEPGVVGEIQCDVRAGGEYRIVMLFDTGAVEHRGTYRELDRPHRIRFTWASEQTGIRDSTVTVSFAPRDNGTWMTIRHERLPDQAIPGHRGCWTSIGERLADHLTVPT